MVAEGKGAYLESHPHDVVMMTKRYAADEQLIQDQGRFDIRFAFRWLFGFPVFTVLGLQISVHISIQPI